MAYVPFKDTLLFAPCSKMKNQLMLQVNRVIFGRYHSITNLESIAYTFISAQVPDVLTGKQCGKAKDKGITSLSYMVHISSHVLTICYFTLKEIELMPSF